MSNVADKVALKVKTDNVVVEAWNPPTNVIKDWVLSAGNKIGNIKFVKKSNGQLRSMCYKLHCKNPSIAKVPSGKSKIDRKTIDMANDNITVLDCNSIVRNKEGVIIGRGSWKSIPLLNITRIKVNKKEIIIKRY